MRYTQNNECIIDNGRTVPCNPSSSDYQEILRRIAEEGLVIDPYIPPPEPTAKERRDARYHSECTPLAGKVILWTIRLEDGTLSPAKRAKLEAKLADAKTKLVAQSKTIESEIVDPEDS
jgi:hypothetical protein